MEDKLEKLNPNVVKKIHREVRFGNYILGSTLGEGEFGKVKLGWRKDGKLPNQVAIKLIKRDTIIKDSELEIKIHREINSLKIINHPNIVNLVEVMKSGKYIGIVLEYASGGELFDYILNHKYLKENIAKKFFAQLVSGVDYLHSKGLIHRDLKLENLLLDKNKNIIITDFGFVNSFTNGSLMKTSCGSPCYAAPELVLTQTPYQGKKVDIWSLGIILYAMLAGYLPFDDDPSNEDGSDIIKLYHYICKTPLTFPEYISPLPRDLLRKIIIPDPKKRIDINAIRNHPWLSTFANLLSIRQPEWDKIYKDRLTIDQPPNNYKRYSMMESTNSLNQFNVSSFKKAHGRSYSYSNQPSVQTVQENPHESSVAVTRNVSETTVGSKGNPKENNVAFNVPVYSSPSVPTISKKSENSRNFESNDIISTIIELPKRNPLSEIKPTPQLAASASNSAKLPHQSKKPRPTSYHPAYYPSNSLLEYKAPSPINIPISQFLSNTSNTSGHSISPPKLALSAKSSSTVSSSSPPKISTSASNAANYPSMTNVPDIKSNDSNMSLNVANNSPTKSEIDSISLHSRRDSSVTAVNVNGVFNSDNKRNSVFLYLEDKIGNFELNESLEDVTQDSTKVSESSKTLQGDDDQDINSKLESINIEDTGKDKKNIADENIKIEKLARKEKIKEKENKSRMDERKKRNRFSLLSIYSNYSEPSHSSASVNQIPQNPSYITKPMTNSSTSSNSTVTDDKFKKSNKEISAAKKVMDFFKRRSVRIN